jgi:hypothetical protein
MAKVPMRLRCVRQSSDVLPDKLAQKYVLLTEERNTLRIALVLYSFPNCTRKFDGIYE